MGSRININFVLCKFSILVRFRRNLKKRPAACTQHPASKEGWPRVWLLSSVHTEPGAHCVGTAPGADWGEGSGSGRAQAGPESGAGLCGVTPATTDGAVSELTRSRRGSVASWSSRVCSTAAGAGEGTPHSCPHPASLPLREGLAPSAGGERQRQRPQLLLTSPPQLQAPGLAARPAGSASGSPHQPLLP